ncbi:MAG: hypothetical protein ACRDTM_04130 [Micromonosporaceae bacterium]
MSGLSRRQRKALLVVHVVTSVAWIGLDLVLITLAAAGLISGNPELLRAGYLAMALLGDTVLVPIAMASLVSGVVLSIGTPWGLVKHWWVLVKFGLTMVMVTAVVFALRPNLSEAAARALQTPLERLPELGVGQAGLDAMVAPSVAMALLLVATVLSVFKPWGRTRWGRREQRTTPPARRSVRQPATAGQRG